MTTAKTRKTLRALKSLSQTPRADLHVENVYGPLVCKFWYRLYFGDYDYDLYPQGVGQQPKWNSVLGEDGQLVETKPPDWWPWWLEDFSLDEAMGFCYSLYHVEEHGRSWRQPWRYWALENGIAPGQLFCMEVSEPEVSKSGWETVEYDIEWSVQLLEVLPLSPASAAKRWERDLLQASRGRLMWIHEAEQNAALIDSDVSSMYIQQSMYIPGSQASWEVPSGRSFRLQTKLRLHPCASTSIGVEGRDDNGSYEVAMARFVENACKANPRLSPELIKTLEVRL